MAAYTVQFQIRAIGSKQGTLVLSPTGNSSSNPLEVTNGDTVTFTSTGSVAGTVTGLAIFSDNSDISFTSSGGSVTRTVTGSSLLSDTVTIGGSGNQTANFYFERQLAEDPTDITFGADPGTTSATVSITATASGGASGTLQVSENNSTWVANGSSFTFTRGTAKTIYARVLKSGNTPTGSYSESHTVDYLQPDLTGITLSRTPDGNLSSIDTGNVVCTIGGGAAPARYRILRTTGSNAGLGNTGDLTGSNTSGTVTLHYADTGDLPPLNTLYDYTIQGQITTSNGGDGVWKNTDKSFQIRRLNGSTYGFEYYNSGQKEVIAHDTSLGQFYAFGTAQMPANSTSMTITISGVSNNGLFHSYLTKTNGENLTLNSFSDTWNGTFTNNTLTITVSGTSSVNRSFNYLVLKTS